MLEEGEEYAIMLYTWRSCSRAIPQVTSSYYHDDYFQNITEDFCSCPIYTENIMDLIIANIQSLT